jgi:hypothetical protein
MSCFYKIEINQAEAKERLSNQERVFACFGGSTADYEILAFDGDYVVTKENHFVFRPRSFYREELM